MKLRHVVDDVLDLQRAIVSPSVHLHNMVPADLCVVGDCGRIIQARTPT